MNSGVNTADATSSGAAVPIMLTELRLPTIKRLWADLAAQSNREGWPAERLLHTLLVSVPLQAATLDLSSGAVDPLNAARVVANGWVHSRIGPQAAGPVRP